MQIFINHIGYEKQGPKKALVSAPEGTCFKCFHLKDPAGCVLQTGEIVRSGAVENWKGYYFWAMDFSGCSQSGEYFLEVESEEETAVSSHFMIEDSLLERRTLPDILNYFLSQHCAGRFDRLSRSAPIEGTDLHADVHGGWYDASGDNGQYLTHLSHSLYLNPQQTPMVVWNFLNVASLLEDDQNEVRQQLYYQLVDEAAYGGDFLVRLKSPEDYFYIGIRNKDYKKPERRYITGQTGSSSFTKDNDLHGSYTAGFREGAGIAIAALARLSAMQTYGCFGSADYLDTAVRVFHHLEKHNTEYLFDHTENIVDDYCALLAATELYAATKDDHFSGQAEKRAASLMGRQVLNGPYPGHFSADTSGSRPYYHPVEAGLPVIALLRYADILPDGPAKQTVLKSVKAALNFHLGATAEIINPFGYGRQYVKPTDGPARTSFFMPHHNETGYWWQGENATVASLSAMAFRAVGFFKDDPAFCGRLIAYGTDQLNWILGLNPFDACMLHGRGHNNHDYYDPLPLACGGICNGITSGYKDESDIAFDTEELKVNPSIAWRWTEQWIPHGAWYALAAGLQSSLF